MVRTLKPYDPPINLNLDKDSLIHFNLRIMTREGDVCVDFGEFADLLSYNDTLSVESPAGSWNLKMRANLANEELLLKIHPGMVVEFYASRNADPLEGVEGFVAQKPEENPPVFQLGANNDSSLHPDYQPPEGKGYTEPPEPDWEDYLDKAPYLLMRGITTSYGRSSAVIGGGGAETTLTLSGESYGAVYRNAQVLTDTNSPTALGKSLEVRFQSQEVANVVPIFYALLRHWTEEFWGEPTGWEARTRPIPVPPDVFCRLGSEGSVWSALQYLSVQGLFQIFVDHTGAIVWEKLPYSGKCQTVIDTEYLKWNDTPLRNWEDLPLVQLPSWQIQSWADRYSCDRLANYVRCNMQAQMGGGGGETNMDAGQCFNMGSIRQYGGPKKLEVAIPARLANTGNVAVDTERDQRVATFMDLVALEVIRWYDRPQQRISLSVRGDAGWKINTRVEVTENWSNPEAIPGEYLILSRAHSINVVAGSWTTQLDGVRDRRTRYLGAGDLRIDRDELGQEPVEATDKPDSTVARTSGTVSDSEELKEFVSPIEADEYWWFERKAAATITKIGTADDYNALIAPWLPPDCEVTPDEPDATATPQPDNT